MVEPDWSDFKLMLALSRGGSVAGAARVLGVDSSTVSRRLASMEQALGACLVLRGGREFNFTAEGKAAVTAAESIESIVNGAVCSIRAAKTEIDGVVRVSIVPTLLRTLMEFLPLAAEKHPKLAIELNTAMRMIDLAKNEADIAIRMAQPTEIDVVAKRAFDVGFGVYAARAYADKHGLPACAEELSQHQLIRYVEQMLHLPWFAWIERYAKSASAMRVDSTQSAVGLVAAGSGIGVLPCVSGDSSPELLRVFPDPIGHTHGWIVYHETSSNSARVRAVADMLGEFFLTRQQELSGVCDIGVSSPRDTADHSRR